MVVYDGRHKIFNWEVFKFTKYLKSKVFMKTLILDKQTKVSEELILFYYNQYFS